MSRKANQTNAGYAVQSKEGTLDKYRNFLTGWGSKYIKMDRSYLHNFDTIDAPNPSGSLVRGQIARCNINHSFKGAAGPFVFDVVCRNGSTWYLRSNTWEQMTDWMLAIFPNSKYELDRLSEGTSQALRTPASSLPPPLIPPPLIPQQQNTNQEFGVCAGEPPPKNPNCNMRPGEQGAENSSRQSGENSSSGEQGADRTFLPSYSDLFDRHDPAVQGYK